MVLASRTRTNLGQVHLLAGDSPRVWPFHPQGEPDEAPGLSPAQGWPPWQSGGGGISGWMIYLSVTLTNKQKHLLKNQKTKASILGVREGYAWREDIKLV